jgi:hypothetical protein
VTFYLSKNLVILLICLTFVGQTMASTVMSYQMMSMAGMSAQEKSHDMSKMVYTDPHMMSDLGFFESEKLPEDCCSKVCNCLADSCSSVAALNKDVSNGPIVYVSTKINITFSLAISQRLTSLYRPPRLS